MAEPRALRISRSLHWAQTPGHWQVGHWPLLGLTGWLRLCPVLSAVGPSVTQRGCCSRFSLCPKQMICNYLNLEQKVARGLQRTPLVPHSDLPAPSPSVHCVPRSEPAAPQPLQVEPQLHGALSRDQPEWESTTLPTPAPRSPAVTTGPGRPWIWLCWSHWKLWSSISETLTAGCGFLWRGWVRLGHVIQICVWDVCECGIWPSPGSPLFTVGQLRPNPHRWTEMNE